MIRITVPGVPAPYRERQVSRYGKTWSTRTDKCKDWQSWCAFHAGLAMDGHHRIDGPVRLDVRAYFPIPATLKGGKNARLLAEAEIVPHIKRPDRTQILKALEDALTTAGVWRDDSQVCAGEMVKLMSPNPRLEIEVCELGTLQATPTINWRPSDEAGSQSGNEN